MFLSSVQAASNPDKYFQSPFSGDFLCFLIPFWVYVDPHSTFNLHFQETFFVSKKYGETTKSQEILFQSPFSGDFLCFLMWQMWQMMQTMMLSISIFRRLSLFPRGRFLLRYSIASFAFHLHFQETFFVSLVDDLEAWKARFFFQSPFSGDFLCFRNVWDIGKLSDINFQSPFSGDFLCFMYKQCFVD